MAKSPTPLWNEIRRQGQQILHAVQSEIAGLEQQLDALRREADRWRSVLQGKGGPLPRGSRGRIGPSASKRLSLGRRSSLPPGTSVDWDSVFKKLPSTFTSEDLEKLTPKLKSRPRARIMALARWSKSGAIKKIDSGKYRKA